jgi:hypothetical protein
MFRYLHVNVLGRVGIDTGQDGLVALEDFVMQSCTNGGNILALVDLTRALGGELMQVVNAAHADGYTQNVAHEFHHATVGVVANECEGQDDLTQPRFGDWKIKKTSSSAQAGAKTSCSACTARFFCWLDKLTTDVVLGCQVADVGRAAQCLAGRVDALGREKFG